MPYTSEEHKKASAKIPRDAKGHFASGDNLSKSDPSLGAKTEMSAETPAILQKKNYDASLDKPLVSIKVNNPFSKLLHWLDDIRRKQTTTFDLKLKIPLLALPIVIVLLGGAFQVFFNLGKSNQKSVQAAIPTPTPVIIVAPAPPVLISRLGTIKASYQIPSLVVSSVAFDASSSPTTLASPTPPSPVRFVLVDKNDNLTFLVPNSSVSLQNYVNTKVIVTGLFDSAHDTMQVNTRKDIEILP